MKLFIALMLVASMVGYAGEMTALKIGEKAPEFKLKNHYGKEYDLAKVTKEHKYTVVMFVSTECPVSNAYNQRMEQIYDSFYTKDVAVLALNSNKAEDVKAIASHAKTHGFKFPVLKDEKNKVADLYGAQVTPETYVIDSNGKILYHGRIDDNRKGDNIQSKDLANALDMLLDGKPVAIA